MAAEVRIDKWLWAMRVFKTRTMATDAVKKGRVTMGGNVVKPSRTVKAGDIIDVKKPPITYTFKVLQISNNRPRPRRRPATWRTFFPASGRGICGRVPYGAQGGYPAWRWRGGRSRNTPRACWCRS